MLVERKALHSLGVAKFMEHRASAWNISPKDAFVIGWNHDIGYEYVQEHHETVGAGMLQDVGVNPPFRYAIAHHGDILEDMELQGLYISKYLLALVEADMSINQDGKQVSFDERVAEIESDGDSSIAQRNVDYLRNYYDFHDVLPPEAEREGDNNG